MKTVYRFGSHYQGTQQRAEGGSLCPGNGTRVCARVAPQRCPILSTSVVILTWQKFVCLCQTRPFFVFKVPYFKVVGFSLLKWSTFRY